MPICFEIPFPGELDVEQGRCDRNLLQSYFPVTEYRLMFAQSYKKMAGTSAVFLSADYDGASPVERDGMLWSAAELHLDESPDKRQDKPSMHNALALEGLEDYDVPENGDVRTVESIGSKFIYFDRIRAWVQMV